MTPQPHARRARNRRLLTAPLLACLIAAGSSWPALADTEPANPASIPPPDSPGPVQAAQLQAASTGQPVSVPSLTTATTSVVANPDGSLTQTTNALPVRVQQNGTWTPLDDTLALNSDGTVSPKATPSTVVLSGGGSGPLVSLTDPAGHALALSMPFTLPTPSLSGNTALYSSVLPGVDLSVSVDEQGTFRDVLIVHDATAAANPALKSLQLAASAPGLTLATDSGGGMIAKAADGSAVFSSPTPIMWDSSTSGAAGASLAKMAATSTSASTDPSSGDGPGTGAQIDPVGLATSGGTLTLTPNQSLLTGTTTTYPVYIDPQIAPAEQTLNYTQVWQACPSADTGWDTEEGNGTTAGEGIGFIQSIWGGCGGGGAAEESFYSIDLSNIPHGSTVSQAVLTLTQTYGSDGGCAKEWPVTLTVTEGINSPSSSNPTTWAHRPYPATGVMAFSQTNKMYSVSGACPGARNTTTFNLASQVDAAQGGTITFGLAGDENNYSTNYGHMRFARNPSIQTTYDLPPTIEASSVNTFPRAISVDSAGNLVPVSPACGSGTPGWIGLTSTNYGASTIDMQSTAKSPISGTNLAIGYNMVDEMLNDGTGHAKQVTYGSIAPGASPRVGQYQMSSTVQDGHEYYWNTNASDGILTSNTVTGCRFDVDVTPPTQATVTSGDFPPSGSGTTPAKYAGQAGSFTLTATDPAPNPSTCTLAACLPASGIGGFRYSLDQPIPTSGFTYQAASSGQLTLSVTPSMWGSHILYVQAVDNAGNVQTVPSTYSFYAPWNPATKVTAGDLTGDGIPDMLATDANGDLILLPGNSDPSTVGATVAGSPATSPDGTPWNKFYIAHRGSLQNSGVDDLFAYNTNTSVMYRYTNDGENGGAFGHFTKTNGVSTITHPNCTAAGRCTGYNNDWSGVTGMIAPGDLAADTTETVANLITKELDGSGKQELWLYQTTQSAPLSNPMLLGTGDWSHFDLIAPGVVGGNLSTNTAGTPMLWARDKTSGIVYSFPLKDTSGKITEFPAPTAAPLTLGIGATGGGHLCLADGNDSAQSGVPAIIWNCDNGAEQSMTFLTDNTVRFHSGLCLNATGTTNDAPVTLATCDGTSAQHWTTDGTGFLKNSASGLCLADPQANPSPGTSLIMYTCETGHAEQNWAALTSGLMPTPLASAPTMLHPVLTTAAYQTVASPGDYTGLGQPNLYGTTWDHEIIDFPGTTANGTTATFGVPQSQGSYSTANGWWNLADGSGTTAADSTTAGHNATLAGGATWSTPGPTDTNHANRVTSSNPNGTVLHTDGTGYANTGSTVIDTTKSFTISAWVDLNSVTTTEIALGEGTTNHQAFYLGLNPAAGGWLFQGTSDDTSTTTYYTAASSTPATAGVWTHLVGVYDASAHTMALYVNGHLTATTSGATLVAATGPLTIGAILTTGSTTPYAQTAGYVSDVHAYQIAMSTAAASTLNDNPPSISQLN